MDTASTDAEKLKVFLQEADEQIQLLDEDIIRLEKEADSGDLIQEIFRAAHTLKGSSGMLGFHKMAEPTHHMEDTLDKVRSGMLAVSPELVDALLESLDALKVLVENLKSGGEGELDITPLIAALQEAAQAEALGTAPDDESTSIVDAVASDADATKRLDAALAEGLSRYTVRVGIGKESAWAAVRRLQILGELSGLGEMLSSVPTQDDIEQEKAGSQFEAALVAAEGTEAVRAAVSTLDDIQTVEVEPWRPGGDAEDESVADAGGAGDDDDRRIIELGREARGKPEREQLEMAA